MWKARPRVPESFSQDMLGPLVRGELSSQDRRAISIAMVVAAMMIAQQIAGKAARDAFFLSNFSASALPAVMVGAAILSVIVVLIVSRLMLARSPARVVPWIFATNAALFAGEYGLALSAQRVSAIVVYLHTAALGAAAVSVFWSVVNERFDPHAAKRAIARIAVGATFGGVLGGGAAWQLSQLVSIPVLFAILAGVNLVCAGSITSIGKSVSRPAADDDAPSGFRVMRETPYLRQLAGLVALGAVAEAAIDFVFKASAQAEYASASRMVTFFAIFYTATGLLTFALQTTLVERALRSVGLTGTVAMRPGVFIGGGVLALVFPRLWAATILRGSAQTVENSFYRSGYEVLYTPLAPSKKRPTKTMIDVGFEKMGVAAGSGIVLLVVATVPAHSRDILLALAAAAGSLALLVCTRLHRGYVEALADSLRAGSVVLDAESVIDRTTMYTLTQTATALDRDVLMREIERIRLSQGAGTTSDSSSEAPVGDPIIAAIVDLRSGDLARIRPRLEAGDRLDPRLVAHVIPLLEHKRYVNHAVAALSDVAAETIGQLTDALVDARTPEVVRRRLPQVLRGVRSQRAVDGLLAGLSDPAFSVRNRCGAALDALVENEPSMRVGREFLFDAVTREAAATDRVATATRLSHIANMLSLVLDRDTIQLAFRALGTDDSGLRGTGLEYLENVVPPGVYAALRPLFKTSPPRNRPARSPRQVVDELLTSVDTQGIDVAAVRAHIETERGE